MVFDESPTKPLDIERKPLEFAFSPNVVVKIVESPPEAHAGLDVVCPSGVKSAMAKAAVATDPCLGPAFRLRPSGHFANIWAANLRISRRLLSVFQNAAVPARGRRDFGEVNVIISSVVAPFLRCWPSCLAFPRLGSAHRVGKENIGAMRSRTTLLHPSRPLPDVDHLAADIFFSNNPSRGGYAA